MGLFAFSILIGTFKVVTLGKITIIIRSIAIIAYFEVSISKHRTISFTTINQPIIIDMNHLLHEIHLQKKYFFSFIFYTFRRWLPFVMSEPGYCLTELSSHNNKSIFNAIAVLMECFKFELVLWSSEKQLKLLWVAETIGDELNLLHWQTRYKVVHSKPLRIICFHNFAHNLYYGHFFMSHEAVVVPFLQPQ